MNIANIFRDGTSRILFSFLIGFGIMVIIFHKPYSKIAFLAIPVSQIEGKIIRHDEKCYTYVSEDAECGNGKF